MLKHQGKKVFLIASPNEAKKALFTQWINAQVSEALIFNSNDYLDAVYKIKNAPPHVLITDFELPKGRAGQIIDTVLTDEELKSVSIIILGNLPELAFYLDEIVTGRIQYLEGEALESEFNPTITKAINFFSSPEPEGYTIKFLSAGDILMKQGEKGEHVYIVKKGELHAYKKTVDKKTFLGKIIAGEFVGEMAYLNGEPRAAHVEAISDCELIEIPVGTFERVLYQRPSWAKALLQTLSRRLRSGNETKK